ncbi:hypothetical protein F0562_031256 [Nyssa sinensis]|uniref:Uncharacterized protein n=1 Tax=Nyssa sinensis TaxID=561372 RepID=A0A5J5ATN2_9ASTE|nr:hypothetical protein F0562_031256 [Nyssa sinensis]
MKNSSTLPSQTEPNPEAKEEGKEEERARCEWNFSLSTIVSSNSMGAPDTLGVIEFDPSDSLLATGGLARKIRIYSLNSLLPHESSGEGEDSVALLDHANACDYYICTPAKLSSLRWKPGSSGRILGSGDYDGVIMEYDLERRVPVFERDEHGGRRVWTMGYSHWDPVLGASGSDDGTMQMWDPRCDGGKCLAMVQPSVARSSVCCVEFNPFGGALIAVGCADRRAYGYDVRRMVAPVLVFDGHQKTVTYVRFLDHHTLVSSGTDGCLKMWHTEDQSLVRTYKGHVSARRRWGEPIWVHGFEQAAQAGCDQGFVSSVCWRQVGEDQCTLVAGGSDGVLQAFAGKRRSFS